MAEVRPIDANALYDQMTKGMKKYLVVEPGTKRIIEYGYHADDVLASIDQAPKLDYEPVRHGNWVEQEDFCGDPYYTCSACKNDWVCIDGTPAENGMRYCPKCGAKMGD